MRIMILKLIVNMAGFYAAALFFPSIKFDTPATILWAGIALGVVNVLIRPLLVLLTFPVNLLTFGLFTLVINTLMVMLTGVLITGLHIPGFWLAFVISLFISALNMLFF